MINIKHDAVRVIRRLSVAHLFILCLSVWSLFSFSSQVQATSTNAAQARIIVQQWLKTNPSPLSETMSVQISSVTAYFGADSTPLYYVVALRPAGYVIVSAEDRIEPIIAFAPHGVYVASTQHPLVTMLSRDLPSRMTLVKTMSASLSAASPSYTRADADKASRKWSKLQGASTSLILQQGISALNDVRVDPLTKTTWSQQTAGDLGQKACYNYYTPPYTAGNLNNYPAGCVATALAQLLYFWQYPQIGVGTNSFTISVDGVNKSVSLRGGDGLGGPYQWANMPLSPSSSSTTVQCQAIGELCADTGTASLMQYAASGSGAYDADAVVALSSVFKFSNTRYAGSDYTNTPDLSPYLPGIVNPNLDAGLPVVFGIYGPDGGHEIICDGYGYESGTLYHHLNMGWSGDDNAWYNLPTIVIADMGYSFNTVTGCMYNLYPTGSGEVISGRVLDASGTPIAGATVTAVDGTATVGTATSNARGIYAFAKVPSATSYTLTAGKTGYVTSSLLETTGTSVSSTTYTTSTSSGNVWGADFHLALSSAIKLEFTVQPNAAGAGNPISPAVQVAVEDVNGSIVTSATTPVTLALSANPGAATLSGSLTVNAVNGVAIFNGLSLNYVGNGYTLSATAGGLSSATSLPFNIAAGGAVKLAFSVQPVAAIVGSAITPAVQVAILDSFGNNVTTATNLVSLTMGANPGAATLGGLVTVAAVNGVASFSTLTLSNAGIGNTLLASAPDLVGATSQGFTTTFPAPTITAIDNQILYFGSTSTSALSFTVGDAITPSAALTVSGVSSNTTLVPSLNIVFAGSGATRTVTVKPVTGKSGVCNITLTVMNGAGILSTTSFTLTVAGPPTITSIVGQLINLGTSTAALAFTVSDSVTPAATLTVTGVSSNSALIHVGGIALTQPNAQGGCSVMVTPVSTYSGTTIITLTVTNGGGLTAKTSFKLTVNARPTISKIANQTLTLGNNVPTLAFTVGDDLTAVGALIITGASSNLTLVPIANIVFSGTGAARTVKVTPSVGQSGTTTITLTVTDGGGLTALTSFVFTLDGPPTISAIANQTINLGTTTTPALVFTVQDSVTAATSLTVTGVSSNTTLVPVANIVLVGSATVRNVTVKTVAGQSGATTITLTVKDASGLTASTSFTVTVNAPPTITTLANQTINIGSSTSAIAFTIGDDLTPATSLTVSGVSSNTTLFPTIRIVFGGSGSTRTVTITPAAGQSGTATITLTVKDGGGLKATASLSVTVNAPPSITSLSTQTINIGSSTSVLAFKVGDDLTPPVSLTVSGVSSNTALVKATGIVLAGPDMQGNCTLQVTPVSTYSGVTTITLTVIDAGGLSTKSRFTLLIVPMVSVSGGSFTMGSANGGAVSTAPMTQQVTLSSYSIFKYPVTVALYRAFCSATSRALPTFPTGYSWTGKTSWSDASLQQHPIVNVSWTDAAAFSAWAGVRLPTEAQYEYAACGPLGNNYPWSGTSTPTDTANGWEQTKCANYWNSALLNISTWPVGSFPAGASWCGAQDLAGNVWEWCADWYGPYSMTPIIDPTGPTTGDSRVLRGGSWSFNLQDFYRGAYRNYNAPGNTSNINGFRCVTP